MNKCELCEKLVDENLQDFFGKGACSACIEAEEEHMDESDLWAIVDRRGKEWVLDKLKEE